MYMRRRTKSTFTILVLFCIGLLYWNFKPLKKLPSGEYATIAKVSIAVNSLATDEHIARCLKSHAVQNSMHGYQHYIHTTALVQEPPDILNRPPGVWSKPAYLLHVLFSELVKPEEERAKWLFWTDADTLILNPHIRLETFLPPAETEHATSNIHMILTENWDGINDGVFFLRVHPWSLALINAHLAFRTYRPDDFLPIREQSAMSYLLRGMSQFRGNWTSVPARWFNAFPVNGTYSVDVHQKPMRPEMLDDGEKHERDSPWKVVKGDMLVHFAGFFRNRKTWIPPWADRAEKYLEEWSSPKYQETLSTEVHAFWTQWIINHQAKFPTAAVEQKYWQDETTRWLQSYNEKLMRISDMEKYEIRRPDI